MTPRVIFDPVKNQMRPRLSRRSDCMRATDWHHHCCSNRTVSQLVQENMTSKSTEPKFSVEQVAKILGGVHPTTVLRLLQKRKLGYYQFGSRKMIGQSHLDNYVSLAERNTKAKSIH